MFELQDGALFYSLNSETVPVIERLVPRFELENELVFNIELDFLDDGKQYVAEIYRDSDDADWKSNPYGFVTETKEVSAGDRIRLNLVPGGGQAIRFRVIEN